MKVQSPPLTFIASAALEPYLRVKLDGSNQLTAADATDEEIGTLSRRALAALDPAAVETPMVGCVYLMVAAGAFSVYARVYGAAGGKIDDVSNENYKGIALDAASGEGSIVRVLRLHEAVDIDPLGGIDGNVLIDNDFIGDFAAAGTALPLDGPTKVETNGLGVTSVDAANGVLKFAFDAVAEAATAALYYANSPIDPANDPIGEFIVGVFDIGDADAVDINFGFASDTHANDFDLIPEFVAFHLDGDDLSLKIQSDDGTTDTAPVDTTVDLEDDTLYAFKIDASDLSDVKFFYRPLTTQTWTRLASATTFDVSQSSANWTPIVHVEKTNNDTTADVRLDRWRVQANR
jgi:hypothetical protein